VIPGATSGSQRTASRVAQSEWTLHLGAINRGVPANVAAALDRGLATSVPGSVLGALIDAGLASDVAVDGLESDVAWASACTWVYRTSVPRVGDGARVRLVFEGVDTVADVSVDGAKVLTTDDMFHRWTVDLGIDDSLGAWDIQVDFQPILPVARAAEDVLPLPRADMYDIPFNQVRKMACSFGWDWGPATITSGLWRAVVVERVPEARLARILLSPTWRDGAVLRGSVVVEGDVDTIVATVEPRNGGGLLLRQVIPMDGTEASFEFSVPAAKRWDVVGRGEQPLYDVVITALSADGAAVDAVSRRVGFRHIALVQEPDDQGRSFEVHVNGARVWARGFNWVPPDVLPERATREHVRALVEEAVEAGATMLRVWGGGVVESEDFYDVCDELGVLVWQDFSFACAAYSEDDEQLARVAREVEDAVVRVGHRTSLALWCGCNENLWGYEDWGWKEKLGPDGLWGSRLYYETIPRGLAELDPHRPYIPGSPFSPDADQHPNDEGHGTTHHWDTWNQLDYVHFEEKHSRFASEFGWQAPASWPTLVMALGHEPSGGADPDLQRLQKHPDGQAALARAVAEHLPHLPTDGRGWYLATQLVQARAIRASIGRFRSLHDTCSGALWWQLDDCWPALSWAVIDVARRRKLGWYAMAETMASRAVIATADKEPHGLTLVNDSPDDWKVNGVLRVVDEAGSVLHAQAIDTTVPADRYEVVTPSSTPDGAVAVVVDASGVRGTRWIVPDLELLHLPADVSIARVDPDPGEVRITITSHTLVRDLVLLAETHPTLANSRVDRQMLLMLPGESATITVRGEDVHSLESSDWAGLLAAGTALVVSSVVQSAVST